MPTTITMEDPETGAPLLAQASLTDCYMVVGVQVITYGKVDGMRIGQQHTPPLQEPFIDECQSHCIGLHLLTKATRGQFFSVSALGTGQGMPTALTT